VNTYALKLTCECGAVHTYATGQASPSPGDIVVCAECYRASQIRDPGPYLAPINEDYLDPDTKKEVERYREALKRFKAELPS
jgi:hypothetical protein